MSNIKHIGKFDTLNDGREKINKHAIDPANRAELNAIDAKSVANQAKQTSQNAEAIAVNTDDRLDNIIAGEMQDAELIDARRPFGSEAFPNLGTRLDVQFGDIVNQKVMFGNGDITDFMTMDEQNIVLSGDSMSFNMQDWQVPSADNSADKNYPGLMSWAHILRDTIIRNDAYFTNAESIDFEVVSSFSEELYGMAEMKYLMPFNNNNLSIRIKRDSDESSIKIKYKHNSPTNKAVLHLNKHRSLEACIFDIYVDDVLKVSNIDVYGNPDFYKGFEMLDVSIDFPGDNKERIISLKNFRIPEGVENTTNIFRVILNGLGTKKQNIALTGEGGVTSEWFLSNLQERVLKYNPRFVALVLGANDIYKNVDVETYKLNMINIVNQIRGQYPQCQILLMSAPSMGHSNTPDSKTIEYNLALRRIAYDKQCYFVDLLELFKQMHTSYWRYDNVHLTKMGSGILGKNIINLLMPENIVDAKWFDNTYYLPYKHVIKGEKLTLLNGWLNVEGYPPLQYTKNGKSVRIFGNIKNGVTTPTTELCLLPPSIRLSNLRVFGVLNLNAADDVSTGALLLNSNGYLRTSYNIKNVNLSIDIQYELD